MKKLSYLIVLTLILGLVLTGCLLSNVGQVPATDQSGITYLTKSVPPPLFSDDFELYAPGTYSGGVGLGDWQYVSGIPSIVSDTVGMVTTQVLGIVGGSYVGEVAAVVGSSTWQDYTLDLDAKKHSGDYFWIAFRCVDPGTYYIVAPSSDTIHIALMKRVNGGTFIDLAPRPEQATVTGTWYHYRIELRTTSAGTNIKVFVDGVKKFDVTDNTVALAAGRVGVGGGYFWAPGSEGRFDNVVVTKVTATGSIKINSDDPSTNNSSVVLNLTATDVVGVTGYRVANGADASGGTIVDITSTTSFNTDIPWNLDPGYGLKTVSVQYRDTIMEWSPNYTDDISVIYNWTGFFRPVDNDVLNVAKAGRAIPVKFSLSGSQGLDIFESGYPKSVTIDCESAALGDTIEETVNAGGSSLNYDATVDQYIYVWKTDKAWAGTCRQLVVKLIDGTFHQADFNFTK